MQRTDNWFDSRKGRFTGSEIHKLMGIKGLGKTGESYIFEKAIEVVFGRNKEDNFTSFDMQRGLDLEPVAFAKFAEIKELDFLTVEPCDFFPFGDNAGASPDGLVGKDAVLEIKCPRPVKFFNLLANGIDAIDSEYIDQMQMEMMCTNSQRCHFFNYIVYNGEPMWHEIIVERDEERIELIKQRIELAVELRETYINQLTKNK